MGDLEQLTQMKIKSKYSGSVQVLLGFLLLVFGFCFLGRKSNSFTKYTKEPFSQLGHLGKKVIITRGKKIEIN